VTGLTPRGRCPCNQTNILVRWSLAATELMNYLAAPDLIQSLREYPWMYYFFFCTQVIHMEDFQGWFKQDVMILSQHFYRYLSVLGHIFTSASEWALTILCVVQWWHRRHHNLLAEHVLWPLWLSISLKLGVMIPLGNALRCWIWWLRWTLYKTFLFGFEVHDDRVTHHGPPCLWPWASYFTSVASSFEWDVNPYSI
jgi:hypothetical protein